VAERARDKIDKLLSDSGWSVQNYRDINLGQSLGIAVRKFPTKNSEADCLLFVDRKVCGSRIYLEGKFLDKNGFEKGVRVC